MADEIVQDSENYRDQSKDYGFREICLQQVAKIAYLGSQEMRSGFNVYDNRPNQADQLVRYVGDTRKEYCGAVEVLHDLLLPKEDAELKKQTKKIMEAIDKVQKAQKSWDDKLKLHRLLFQELCLFLERLGWLESSHAEE